jgi:hypothetical protein
MIISGLVLGSIQTYGTRSGYFYLHLPQHICKQFNITPTKKFSIICVDGKIILEEEDNVSLGTETAKG